MENFKRKAMKKIAAIIIVTWLFCACSSRNGPLAIFQKLSPHDQYGRHLTDAGLAGTALGAGWLQESQTVLGGPLKISLPYLEKGYFPSDKTSGTAFIFEVRRGQKIAVAIIKKPAGFIIYADLMLNGQTVASADSTSINFEVKVSGSYMLRVATRTTKRR